MRTFTSLRGGRRIAGTGVGGGVGDAFDCGEVLLILRSSIFILGTGDEVIGAVDGKGELGVGKDVGIMPAPGGAGGGGSS